MAVELLVGNRTHSTVSVYISGRTEEDEFHSDVVSELLANTKFIVLGDFLMEMIVSWVTTMTSTVVTVMEKEILRVSESNMLIVFDSG